MGGVGIDLGFNATLAAQIFHFVLLLVLLRVFAYRPLLKILDDRRQLVAEHMAAAENNRVRARMLYRQRQAELEEARDRAAGIIARAEAEAGDRAHRIIADARAATAEMQRRAVAEIDRERGQAHILLRRELAGLVMRSTEKVVGRVIDDREHKRLIEEAVGEAGDERWRIDV